MSKITLKLFASLAKISPENIGGEIKSVPIQAGDTITSIAERSNLSNKNLHLVILNGTYIDKDKRASTQLTDGDTLSFWPPVVGG